MKANLVVLLCIFVACSARHGNVRSSISKELNTLEVEIDELFLKSLNLEEEDPRTLQAMQHYEEMYASCDLDLANALECAEQTEGKVQGFGKRFAVCAVLEVDAEKTLSPIRAITSFLSKPIVAPVKAVMDMISLLRKVFQGKWLNVVSDVVDKLNPASAAMNLIAQVVYVFGRLFTDVDVKATLCALCAASMAHAIAARILSPDFDGETVGDDVRYALRYSYRGKPGKAGDNNICGLDVTARTEIAELANDNQDELLTNVLIKVRESRARIFHELLYLRVNELLAHPVMGLKSLLTEERELIEQASRAILHPAATLEVPISQGGFEVEDITEFYFTDGVEPDLKKLSLRQCGRACAIVTDARQCASDCQVVRSCNISECTIA